MDPTIVIAALPVIGLLGGWLLKNKTKMPNEGIPYVISGLGAILAVVFGLGPDMGAAEAVKLLSSVLTGVGMGGAAPVFLHNLAKNRQEA